MPRRPWRAIHSSLGERIAGLFVLAFGAFMLLYAFEVRLTWLYREGRPLPIPGAVRACMHLGGVLYEWGDLEAAERYLDLALDTVTSLRSNVRANRLDRPPAESCKAVESIYR